MADAAVRRAVLELLTTTPFGSMPRRQLIRDCSRSAALTGVPIGEAHTRVQREISLMVADRLLGPAGDGMCRLTDAGRRASSADVEPLALVPDPTRSPVAPRPADRRPTASTVAPHQRPVLPTSPAEAAGWAHAPGTRMSREERAAGYGGSTYGGIQPSSRTPNVFLYTDPGAGQKNGYDFDGWAPDGADFTYTGEGRTGSQEMTKGNKAILEHRAAGKHLRVFAADGTLPDGGAAKDHVYLGEFAVDEGDPYRVERAPDQLGNVRDVFVFRLVPVGEVLRRQQDGQHTPLVASAGSRGTGSGVSVHLAGRSTSPAAPPWNEQDDERVRREVAAWLTIRSHDGAVPIPTDELRGVVVDGRRVPLINSASTVVTAEGSDTALTLTTPYPPGGRGRPFEDLPADDGMLRVAYRGSDPLHPENRALRRAVERGAQLVWLFGVGPGSYLPVFPVFALAEDVARQEFVLHPNAAGGTVAPGSVVEEQTRRYLVAQTRRRLHQPVFRATVLRAYSSRCAVCSLRHEKLLDAAHIVPDADPRGIASVRNGLALCKIHHAAFDADILGIRPQVGVVGVVEIRADVLEEVDGPMLQHGLLGHHGLPLRVTPTSSAEQPDRELLEQRYDEFRGAM